MKDLFFSLRSSDRCGQTRGRCSQRALLKILKENLHYRDRSLGSHRKQEWSHRQRRKQRLSTTSFVIHLRVFYCLVKAHAHFLLSSYRIHAADYRSVPDAAQPSQQTKRSQQSAFPFPPGGWWDGWQVWRRGQPASAAREAHQPPKNTRTWVRPDTWSSLVQFSLLGFLRKGVLG